MAAFYLTLIAVLFSGLAGRDQMIVAALTRRQGQRTGVLVVALVLAALTCGGAGYVAGEVLRTLPPPARSFLAAIVIALAGLESLILRPRKEAREPTHSLGALGIVLLASQVTDSARFTLFGVAVGTGAPLAAGLGGGLAGLVLVAAAWAFPHAFAGLRGPGGADRPPVRRRIALAGGDHHVSTSARAALSRLQWFLCHGGTQNDHQCPGRVDRQPERFARGYLRALHQDQELPLARARTPVP